MKKLPEEERKKREKERNRRYYEEHKAERIAYQRKWYDENKEHVSQWSKQYHQDHREERCQKAREYQKEHPRSYDAETSYYHQHKDDPGFKEAWRQRAKEWREANPEKVREMQRQYRKDHPEKIQEYKKRDYEKHKDKRLTTSHKYHKEHKEEIAEKQRLYDKENRDKRRENYTRWASDEENRLRIRLATRAREYKVRFDQIVTIDELRSILQENIDKNDGNLLCHYCSTKMDLYAPRGFTFDHIKKKNGVFQLVPCCYQCNTLKGKGNATVKKMTREPGSQAIAMRAYHKTPKGILSLHIAGTVKRMKLRYGANVSAKLFRRVIANNTETFGKPTCYYCHKELDIYGRGTFHFAHIEARKAGGSNEDITNWTLACPSCNYADNYGKLS